MKPSHTIYPVSTKERWQPPQRNLSQTGQNHANQGFLHFFRQGRSHLYLQCFSLVSPAILVISKPGWASPAFFWGQFSFPKAKAPLHAGWPSRLSLQSICWGGREGEGNVCTGLSLNDSRNSYLKKEQIQVFFEIPRAEMEVMRCDPQSWIFHLA